jgi:PST family polysaccharide transporter
VFRLLAPTILAFALINPTGWLLVSLGMVERSLKIALVIAPLVATGCLIGLPHGPQGVALGFSAAMTLWVIPHLLWVFHDTVISYRDVLSVVGRPLISGFAGALAAYAVTFFLGAPLSPFARLLLGCAVLFIIYAWVLLFAMGQRVLYIDILRILTARSSDERLASG